MIGHSGSLRDIGRSPRNWYDRNGIDLVRNHDTFDRPAILVHDPSVEFDWPVHRLGKCTGFLSDRPIIFILPRPRSSLWERGPLRWFLVAPMPYAERQDENGRCYQNLISFHGWLCGIIKSFNVQSQYPHRLWMEDRNCPLWYLCAFGLSS